MSLTLRIAVAMTLAVALPLLYVLVPRLFYGGVSGPWLAVLVVGWGFVVTAVIASAAWLFARALLTPVYQFARWIRHGLQGKAPDDLPIELRAIQSVLLEREARRANDESARSLQLATLVHDMRTPLLAVDRSLGYALDGSDSPSKQWIEPAREEVQRLLSVVGDVVDFGRLRGGVLEVAQERFELHPVISGVISRLAPLRDDVRIALSGQLDYEVVGDPRLLTRVFENVIGNALKHAANEVRVQMLSGLVRIADDGGGMAFTAASSTPLGSTAVAPHGIPRDAGLGLTIATSIIEAHRGRLVLESSGSTGTVMLVYISPAPVAT